MSNAIIHCFNLIRHSFRDIGLQHKRSSHWPKLEKEFLQQYPTCAACGGNKRLNVHHIKPFHIFPEEELNIKNLITLCMGRTECHLLIGHGAAFKFYNPYVLKDVDELKKDFSQFNTVAMRAKANRIG